MGPNRSLASITNAPASFTVPAPAKPLTMALRLASARDTPCTVVLLASNDTAGREIQRAQAPAFTPMPQFLVSRDTATSNAPLSPSIMQPVVAAIRSAGSLLHPISK